MAEGARVSLANFLAMEENKPYRELIDGEVVENAIAEWPDDRVSPKAPHRLAAG